MIEGEAPECPTITPSAGGLHKVPRRGGEPVQRGQVREAEGLEAGVDAVGGGVVTGPGLLDPRLQIPPLLVGHEAVVEHVGHLHRSGAPDVGHRKALGDLFDSRLPEDGAVGPAGARQGREHVTMDHLLAAEEGLQTLRRRWSRRVAGEDVVVGYGTHDPSPVDRDLDAIQGPAEAQRPPTKEVEMVVHLLDQGGVEGGVVPVRERPGARTPVGDGLRAVAA